MDTTLEELQEQLEQTKRELLRQKQEQDTRFRFERKAEMTRLRDEGLTYEAIGAKYGLTRQRAWAIINEPDENNE